MDRRKGVVVNETERKFIFSLKDSYDYIKHLNDLLIIANGYGCGLKIFNHEDYGFEYVDKLTLITEEEFNESFKIDGMSLTGKGLSGIDIYDSGVEFIKSNFGKAIKVKGVVERYSSMWLNIENDEYMRHISLPITLFVEYDYMEQEGKSIVIIN